jgi:hypothetical protein
MVVHPLRFRLAHRDLAAFLAICFRRLAETVFIRTLADFRPIAAKYSDSFLSIIARLYTQPLSIAPETGIVDELRHDQPSFRPQFLLCRDHTSEEDFQKSVFDSGNHFLSHHELTRTKICQPCLLSPFVDVDRQVRVLPEEPFFSATSLIATEP